MVQVRAADVEAGKQNFIVHQSFETSPLDCVDTHLDEAAGGLFFISQPQAWQTEPRAESCALRFDTRVATDRKRGSFTKKLVCVLAPEVDTVEADEHPDEHADLVRQHHGALRVVRPENRTKFRQRRPRRVSGNNKGHITPPLSILFRMRTIFSLSQK